MLHAYLLHFLEHNSSPLLYLVPPCSEDIRGEILYVLYKLSLHLYASMQGDGTDPFVLYCPKLLYLSLDALQKTERDDVRSNCIGLWASL